MAHLVVQKCLSETLREAGFLEQGAYQTVRGEGYRDNQLVRRPRRHCPESAGEREINRLTAETEKSASGHPRIRRALVPENRPPAERTRLQSYARIEDRLAKQQPACAV